MNELALFAGAGGGILGGHLLGWRCVCAVEWEPYPAAVLAARQNEGFLPPFPIWDDVQTFDGRPWRGLVDVVSGGFPCQDISAAGKGAGIEGERSGMWKHMARIISEVRPRYVLVENSPVLTSRGLGVVLGDLAAMGYDAEWGVLGAVHAGAPHQRERIWIMAYAKGHSGRGGGSEWIGRGAVFGRRGQAGGEWNNAGDALIEGSCGQSSVYEGQQSIRHVAYSENDRRDSSPLGKMDAQEVERGRGCGFDDCSQDADVADAKSTGAGSNNSRIWTRVGGVDRGQEAAKSQHANGSGSGWWSTEPNVGRVANGVAARVDRLKATGNGQVPAVVRLAWHTLHERLMNR